MKSVDWKLWVTSILFQQGLVEYVSMNFDLKSYNMPGVFFSLSSNEVKA